VDIGHYFRLADINHAKDPIMLNLKNKKITILGGKRSGMALAKLIQTIGGESGISEQGPRNSLPNEFLLWAEKNRVRLEFDGHTKGFIQHSDVVVLSPGVRLDSEPVRWAKEKNIPVLGEIEFAFQFCNKPVIAVTGSNGKTTTVTLIHKIIQEAGKKACLCGNVGVPFSDYVLNLSEMDYVVLEISSFQLESMLDTGSSFRQENAKNDFSFKGFEPHVGVILNFSQNHLDRHKDLNEYFEAKTRMFMNQTTEDYAVLNFQNESLKKKAASLKSQVRFFNQKEEKDITNPNYLAVTEVAQILGISRATCLQVFNNFKGVEHRLEVVRELDGVEYINDSKATTAEAGGWALKNMAKPTILICGGRDKNIQFSVLHDLVKEKVKKMIVIGEAKEKLKATFHDVVPIYEADSLESAVALGKELAQKGDAVLLSPMCASFDMFKDYEHRGKTFKEIVNRLKHSSLAASKS
jgi:UDP-N-acetylmuramoylalanine--D-glutamate ligase